MKKWSALAIVIAFAGALAFRLPRLETRPFHNDEAVNALKAVELWQHGRYHYDPDEYHGPALHYATLPFLALSGAHSPNELPDAAFRIAPVLFGSALILLLFFFADGLPALALVWSAVFIAVSPAMVFYSRYFIHEMLLVFFTAMLLGAGWRFWRRPSPAWALLAGAALGLMFATKETFVITVAAMAIAAAALHRKGAASALLAQKRNLALFLSAALVIWFLFFSSFFTHFGGLLDSVRTYFPWLKRAAGHSPHLHPWYFYLERLAWFHPAKGPAFSEALILALALVGTVVSFRGTNLLERFLAIYTIVLTAAYCVISYKTPWCLLSFYFGMILLAGIGAAALFSLARNSVSRTALMLLLLAGTAQLAVQAWRGSYVEAADRRNPWVYAQTVPDVLKMVSRVEGIARVCPAGFDTVVKVIAPDSDYWPLPWYLRRFRNIGWYDALPKDPFAPIVIVSSRLDARLDEKSGRKWIMAGLNELRPGQFFELYVELSLWTKYVETLPPEPD